MFFPGFGSGQEKIMDPDPVCPKRLDSDLVNFRPDSKPCALPLSLVSSGWSFQRRKPRDRRWDVWPTNGGLEGRI